MKIRSIFSKFMIPVILIVCIFAGVILTVTGNLLNSAYEKKIIEHNKDTSSFIAQSVGGFMDKAYTLTEEMAVSEAILTMDNKTQTPIVEGTAQRNDYFELIYIQDMNGDQTARSSGELGNRAERWWFTQMLETKKPFVSKSYYSVNTNMACASIFYPLVSDDKMIGIFATDIKLATLQSLVEEYSDLEDGRVSFIIDGEGTVIAHPESVYYEELYNYKNLTRTISKKDSSGNTLYDESGNILTEEKSITVSKDYAAMVSEVMSGKDGSVEITDQGIEYYASYAPVALGGYSDTWSVITLQNKDNALSVMQQVNKIGIIVTVIAVIVVILLIALITGTITKPIKLCLGRLKQLADGDLTTVVPAVRSNDESAELLNNLNKTIGILSEMMQDITLFVQRIAQGDFSETISNEFKGEFNLLAASLGEINDSIGNTIKEIDISAGKFVREVEAFDAVAQMLADGTTSQAGAEEELSATLADISEKVNRNADNTRQADQMMVTVEKELKESNQNLKALVEAMSTMEEDSNEISSITKLMQNIAAQTNLLSMNASVEAARAGDAGRGFAVVASEIRDLAAKCNEAAVNTAELIDKTCKNIQDGMEHLDVTVVSLKKVSAENQNTGKLIRDISCATEEQTEALKQISAALEQISNVTQSNSTTAEESAQTSREMRQSVGNLKRMLGRYRY